MGFLDMFDDPNIMSTILGANPPNNSPGGPPGPTGPSRTMDTSMGPGAPGAGPAPVIMPPPSAAPRADQLPMPNQPTFDQRWNNDVPPAPAPGAPPPGMTQPSGHYNLLPGTPNPDLSSPSPIAIQPSTGFPGGTDMSAKQPRAPIDLHPAGAPPAAPPAQPENRLANLLGVNPETFNSALAGLGKGLSSVGRAPFGASAGQQFAGGMGGALEGEYAGDQQQKQRLFNNQSTYFRNWLTAKRAGDQDAVNKARANYFNSMATSIMAGRGRNGGAWQQTDWGKTAIIEKNMNDWERTQNTALQKELTSGAIKYDEYQQKKKDLDAQAQQKRAQLYGMAGLDPKKISTYQSMGHTKDNPIDTSKMTMDQFNAAVPVGAWYKGMKDGKPYILQRKVGPPAAPAAPAAPAPAAPGAMPGQPWPPQATPYNSYGALYEANQPPQ